jgi:cobalt-zinc-cadmium efflux system membrane fusion protein
MVKKGDPLLEIFSPEVAAAKHNYETAISQHARDKKVLDYKAPLAETNAIPRKDLIEAQNDEAKSNLRMKLTRDQLLVHGLTDAQIEMIPREEGSQRASMVLCSPVAGLVVKRMAVPGNYYDPTTELIEIAQDDPLWVVAMVPESQISRLAIGDKLSIRFPYSDRILRARLEAIGAEVNPGTQTVEIRASISNPDHRLKAGMFASVELQGAAVSEPRIEPPIRKQASPPSSVDERLSALEAKLERLLKDRPQRSNDEQILERLFELERKVDRLLESRQAK